MNIRALWNFSDLAGTENAFRQAITEATSDDSRAQLQTQLARVLGLLGRFDEAQRSVDDAAKLAQPGSVAAVRVLLERGRLLRSAGDPAASEPHFVEAIQAAQAADSPGLEVDAMHMIALVHMGTAAGIEWNRKALARAEDSDDSAAQRWRGPVMNNLAWDLFDASRYDEALEIFDRDIVFRGQNAAPHTQWIARWSRARTLRALERYDEAVTELEALTDERREFGDPPDGKDFEELAECKLALGCTDEARVRFAQAFAILSDDESFADHYPDRLERMRNQSQVGDGESSAPSTTRE